MANRISASGYIDTTTKEIVYGGNPDYDDKAHIDHNAPTSDWRQTRNGSALIRMRFDSARSHSTYRPYLKYEVDDREAYLGLRIIRPLKSWSYPAHPVVFRLAGENQNIDVVSRYGVITTPDGKTHRDYHVNHSYLEVGYDGADAIVRLNNSEIYRKSIALGRIKNIEFFAAVATAEIALQDLYINDGKGDVNNSFWGEVSIDLIDPSAVAELDRFAEREDAGPVVDQITGWPSDKSASYVEGVNIGSKCLASFASDKEKLDVKAVYLIAVGTKMATSESGIKLILEQDGKSKESSKRQFPVGEYKQEYYNFSSDASGKAWTLEKLKRAKFGVEIVG